MTQPQNDADRRGELARFGIGLISVFVAGYFFFTLERPLHQSLALAASLIVGEIVGRAAERWFQQKP